MLDREIRECLMHKLDVIEQRLVGSSNLRCRTRCFFNRCRDAALSPEEFHDLAVGDLVDPDSKGLWGVQSR